MRAPISKVINWLMPEQVLIDVEVNDVTHALTIIAEAIADRHGLEPDRVLRALARRESAGSTAVGAGFAIPHGRISGLERPLTLLLRTSNPVDFKAPDGAPVSLMLGIMVPDDGHKDEHLQLLSLVAELFSSPGFRASIDSAPDVGEITELFWTAATSIQREHLKR